jgi:hypothetical protein
MVTRIHAAFKSKNIVVTTPDPSISKLQKLDQIMQQPEMQKLKNELTIQQGNEFLDLIATQYQIQDLDMGQRFILGMAMNNTLDQIRKAENQINQVH